MGLVTVGVDVGQRRDPTAIAVAEWDERRRVGLVEGSRATPAGGQATVLLEEEVATDTHFVIRHLDRLPLNLPYPEIAERVAALVRRVAERAGAEPSLFVDATGVGTPLVDVLEAVPGGLPARVTPVYFTHGDRRTWEGVELRLGKAFLVSQLQALLQGGRLHLPKTAEAQVLASELLDYEIRISEDANDRYGAFKVGRHDDLVTALGLAVQRPRATWNWTAY